MVLVLSFHFHLLQANNCSGFLKKVIFDFLNIKILHNYELSTIKYVSTLKNISVTMKIIKNK